MSSLVSSVWQGGDHVKGKSWGGLSSHAGSFGKTGLSTVLFGTLAGAGGAALAKGNIWAGAATGFAVSFFNHLAHENGWFDNVKSGESSPGNSGEVLFQNLTDTQLEDYRIIPEDAQNYKPLVKPENDVVYQVDGVYMKDFNNDRYWYKIGNGLRLTISGALGAGPINFVLTTTSYWGHLSKLANRYGYKNKSEDHWYRPYEFSSNGNPFDQFKFPFKL